MKYCLTLYTILCIMPMALAQYVTIEFTNGDFTVSNMVSINKAESDVSTWRESANSLEQVFYQYNFPDDLQTYKALFHDSGYPEYISDVYDDWRQKMNGVEITGNSVFYGLHRGNQAAIISHTIYTGDIGFQNAMLFYRIQGKWHPVKSSILRESMDMNDFFSIIHQEFLEEVIDPSENGDIVEFTHQLEECSGSQEKLQVMCFVSTLEGWVINDRITQLEKESPVFRKRLVKRTSIPDYDPVHLNSLATQYELSDQHRSLVIHYADREEWMLVANTLRLYDADTPLDELYSQLNAVIGIPVLKAFDVTGENPSN